MSSEFKSIFNQLKPLMSKYEDQLIVKADTENNYYLDSKKVYPKNNKPYFFGAVQVKKNYVSYHLMPVYVFSSLLDHISPNLKKRMQGKSCFNFKKQDDALFEELEKLTNQAFNKYKEEQMI